MSLRYLLELTLKLIPRLFSGFKAALLALLFLLFSVVQERWVALQIGNGIFLSLAWRCFLDQHFRLVVGSVEVVGFSSFCVT